MFSVNGMSSRSVIEETFARILLSESIFDDATLAASLRRVTSMKDIQVVSKHYVYRSNSDDESAFADDDSDTRELARSISESGILLKKRIIKSGLLSPHCRRRKSVSFADTKGRDLVQVREFDNNVDPIQNCLSDKPRINRGSCCSRYVLKFSQPCANYSDFMRQLFTQKVCLENAQIISGNVLIGTVKVQNIFFEKYLTIRYTTDSWKTFHDTRAKFLHSESAEIDVFTFRVEIPKGVSNVDFCVRFWCNDNEFWDNNHGLNYSVRSRDPPASNGRDIS